MSIYGIIRHALAGIVLYLFIFSPACPAAVLPLQKVVITFADFSERTGLLFVAKDQHLFEEQGLDAQIVQVRSGPIAISALAAGDAQFYTAPASGATLGATAGGLDLAFVAGLINKLDGYFMAGPNIKTPADLKGKTLGVQSIGGGIWMFTMMALDHWGLSPERDKIQFRVIGDQSVIAQAMATGLVDGALLGYTFSKVAERQGYHVLADLPKANVPYQQQGLLARRSYVDNHQEIAEKTLKALVKANVFLQAPGNKQAVVKSLVKWLRLPRLEGAEDLYARMTILFDRRIAPTRDGLQNALRVLAKVDPKLGALKVSELMDDRIVKKLEQQGLF